jgi:hypothetical protein
MDISTYLNIVNGTARRGFIFTYYNKVILFIHKLLYYIYLYIIIYYI